MDTQKIDFMDGVDIIYWINLEKSKDRRNSMETMFKDDSFKNSEIQRINAINGNEVNIFKYFNINKKQKSNPEYGCLLSHLETIRNFSKSSYKYALIMEDDLTLDYKKYWKKSLKNIIKNAPSDWDVIQLCYITTTGIIPNTEYELNNNRFVSAAAYIIKKSSAINLINSIYDKKNDKYNIENNRNHHADVYIFSKLKTYVYKYPYFIYKKNNYSTLHPRDVKEHSFSREIISNMYKKIYPEEEGFTSIESTHYNNLLYYIFIFFILLLLFIILYFIFDIKIIKNLYKKIKYSFFTIYNK
jgi:GR25 family glycosyltransferase involved in LPS biosynthesis